MPSGDNGACPGGPPFLFDFTMRTRFPRAMSSSITERPRGPVPKMTCNCSFITFSLYRKIYHEDTKTQIVRKFYDVPRTFKVRGTYFCFNIFNVFVPSW
jgi:hypothetical protein